MSAADLTLVLPLAIVVPMASAVLSFWLPRLAWPTALASSLLTSGLVALLVMGMLQAGAVRHAVGGWGAPLGIDLVLDGMAALMLLLTALVGIPITLYARAYFADEPRQAQYFWPLWLFLWAALNALFMSGDVFNLYVTLELMGFSAIALTALAGKRAVLQAAVRYLYVSLAGSLLYLMGVAFLYGAFGTLDISLLGEATTTNPSLIVAAALITGGLMMKTALFPLHFWLPPAHANAAAPVSALLSALVVKGSFVILLRLWLEVFYPLADTFVPQMIALLGVGAILWGSVQAIQQTRLKLLVAYSTVAQLGYLFLLIPVAITHGSSTALAGILLFVLAHACAKAAAFLSAGTFLHVLGTDKITSLKGAFKTMPLSATTFSLAGISLIGLPPSSGFIAKYLLLDASVAHQQWGLAAIILLGGLLAGVYITRVIAPFFSKPASYGSADYASVDHSSAHAAPRAMTLPAFALALLAILLGFAGVALIEVLGVGMAAVVGGRA